MKVLAPACPYKGLASFDESSLDALLFFGRRRETEIVVANLLAYRLSVLYGASGVGKSSLLRAGVANRLRASAEEVVVFDVWSGDPASTLLAQLAELPGREPYLILDQFDEFFVYQEAGDELARELAQLITDPQLSRGVLISIRDDMLSRLDAFKALVPNLLSNYLRLDHLDRRAAREAIAGPLERYNGLVSEQERVLAEPELVEAVLDGSASDGHVEAPYLQLVMQRLWEEMQSAGSRTLRLETLELLGGAEEIVRAHLVDALNVLPERDRDLAAQLFNHLVTPSGTKVAHGIGDLAQYAAASEGEISPVLAALVDERIVRPVTVPGAPEGAKFEIFHDVLAEPVVAWTAKHDADRVLEREREDSRRRHRRLLVVVAAALFAVLAMLGLTVFALDQRSTARSEALVARGRELASRALAGLDTDPQRSLHQAVAAARLSPGVQTEETLRRVLVRSYERAVLPQGSPALAATITPNGRRLVVSTAGKRRILTPSGRLIRENSVPAGVRPLILDSSGRLVAYGSNADVYISPGGTGKRTRLRNPGPVSALALSPDASLAAAVAKDRSGRSQVRTFTLRGARQLRVLPEVGMRAVAFSPNGRMLATGSADGSARLWDARTGRLLHVLPHLGDVVALSFSRDGRMLATASLDGLGRVWDAATGGSVVVLPGSTQPLRDISFSPDGRFVVTASGDGRAYVYRVDDSLLVAVLAGSRGGVNSAVFGPGGRSVVTSSDDGTVRVWRPGVEDQLRLVRRVRRPVVASFGPGRAIVTKPATDPAQQRVVSPDRTLVAKVDGAGVLLTDRSTGRTHVLTGHFVRVYPIAFSPDSRWLVTGAQRAAILWRLSPGERPELFSYLYGHSPMFRGRAAHLTSVAFSPDGRLLVTASTDRTVRVYGCDVCGGLSSLVDLAQTRLARLRQP